MPRITTPRDVYFGRELLTRNPRGIDEETMKKVLQCVYDGADVDF